MIYEVYLDGKLLYYPDDEKCVIINAKLSQALNDAGEFEFEVPSLNPLYEEVRPRASMVQILKDGKEVYYGEVRETEETLDFTKRVYTVGELAFLFDSIQPQARYQNYTVLQFFSVLVQQHNAQVEEKKRFEIGVVTVTDPNDSLYRYTNYEDTLSAIRDKLCDRLSGYLRIRKEKGRRFLDLVRMEDYGKTSNQKIEFGENLLEYAANMDGNNIATAVIPLGARLDVSQVEGLDAYTTIRDVNNGKDYLFCQEAVDRFGWIKKVVHFDDVTIPENLKRKGQEWLESSQFENLTLELNAVDMSVLDSDIDGFEVGDMIHASAEPFGMSAIFPLQAKTTYLQEHDKNYIMLSNTGKRSYTQQMCANVSSVRDEIPQKSTILNEAKKNSSDLIKAATNGYIVIKMGESGNPEELLIMDTSDINTARKVWRWNINGLGYSSTGYNGTYGTAITMDGKIVADFILAGTMVADRIRGGTLTLGGLNNTNGIITILDKDGKQIGKWDKDGIEATGTFKATGISSFTGEEREARLTEGTLRLLNGDMEETVLSISRWASGVYTTALGSALAGITMGFISGNGKIDTYYVMNNGLNPNGFTERHLFNQRMRSVNGLNTPVVYLMPSGDNLDESKWCKLKGTNEGAIIDGDFTVNGTLKNEEGNDLFEMMRSANETVNYLSERMTYAYEMIAEINNRIDLLENRVTALEGSRK